MASPSRSRQGRVGSPSDRLGGTRALVFLLVNGLLLAFTYRDLLTVRLRHGAAVEIENWFFVADETSPAIVVAMAGWLLFRRWSRLRKLPPATSLGSLVAGLAAAAGAAFVVGWSIFTASADLLAASLSMAILAFAAILRGAAGARLVFLSAFLLWFAVKIPGPLLNEIAFRLQLLTAEYTGTLLYLAGMPALVSGEQIIRASARFAVIENCSGLRSMETLSMLAVLMIDLFHRRGSHAVLLVALAPLVAFFVNGFRVVLLVVNPHSEVAAIHNLQGIAMLLGGLFLLYGIDAGLGRVLPAKRQRGGGAREAGTASRIPSPHPDVNVRPPLVTAILVGTAVISIAVPIYGQASPIFASIHLALPRILGPWEGHDLPMEDTFLGLIAMRQHLFRRYTGPEGERVKLYVGLGNHTRASRGPFSPKTALPGSGWVVEEDTVVERGETTLAVRVVRSRGQRRLVYHWVEGSAGFIAEASRVALALDQSPWRRQRDSVVIRISTALESGDPASRARAEDLLQSFQQILLKPLEELDRILSRKSFS